MNIKCVYCTAISHEYNAKFCTKCGARLRESSDTRTITEDTSLTQMMILSGVHSPYDDTPIVNRSDERSIDTTDYKSSISDYSSSYSSSDSGSSDSGGGGGGE
jgi:hypothetical protein